MNEERERDDINAKDATARGVAEDGTKGIKGNTRAGGRARTVQRTEQAADTVIRQRRKKDVDDDTQARRG